MGGGGGQNYRQSSRAHSFGRFNKKKAGQYGESGKIWDEWEKSQNLKENISSPSSHITKFCYNHSVMTSGEDLRILIEKLPHVRRTDPDANLVQTFFTSEEKRIFEDACGDMKMSHVLRCLALQYAKLQQEAEKKQA